MPMRKSSCLPSLARRGELREQRGLHGLEQQERDAGDEEAGDEAGGIVLRSAGVARS